MWLLTSATHEGSHVASIYDPTLIKIYQSMWKVEPNVNLFSQQQTKVDKAIPTCLSFSGRWHKKAVWLVRYVLFVAKSLLFHLFPFFFSLFPTSFPSFFSLERKGAPSPGPNAPSLHSPLDGHRLFKYHVNCGSR